MATDPIVDTRVAPRRRSISHDEYKCPSREVLSGWMAVAIGPGSHAESFIWAATLCARRAGRSAEDRLLCKQEVLGSNPSRSTQVQAGGVKEPPKDGRGPVPELPPRGIRP